MMFKGVLKKMIVELDNTVNYFLDFGDDFILMNSLIGRSLKLNHIGFECLNCKSDQILYRQGFCKNCFFEIPSTAEWIMKPELSKAHLNIEERDLSYEKEIQLKPHILYLAFSSSVKVGVTRESQVPFRWIDQGAIKAVEIARFPNRYLAGISEVSLKDYFTDKTNWREMLKVDKTDINLELKIAECISNIPNEAKKSIIKKFHSTLSINYPVEKYPSNPKSLNLIKQSEYQGKLVGIKGQYLIFDDENVFNIRSNEGVLVELSLS